MNYEQRTWSDNDPKAPNSPWGKVQGTTILQRGVRWVSTAGHGGMMISKGLAKKLLSPAALALGDVWGGYVCYEEDCLAAIPAFEVEAWRGGASESTIRATIAEYYPDYLLNQK